MNTGNKSSYWIVLAILLPFLAVVALMVSAGSGQVVPAPTEAKIHKVAASPLVIQENYIQQKLAYGRVEATKQANAGFERAGYLTEVLVDEGQQVSKGQIIALLDTQRLDASIREVDAAIQRAQADARLATLSERRVVELVKQKLESPQRLDEARERTIAANALVTEVQARLDSLHVELAKSRILAPFDGEIIARPVDPGTVIAAGQTVFVLRELGNLEARIALSADDAFGLQLGQQYPLQSRQGELIGTLKSIAKQRKLNTRTVDVIFSLQNTNHSTLPGDLIEFSFEQEIQESGVWVPRQALSSGVRGLWTVFVVSQSDQQRLEAKSVELLYAEEERAYVRGPLSQGELLVINGTQRLVPQQMVSVQLVDSQQLVRGQSHE